MHRLRRLGWGWRLGLGLAVGGVMFGIAAAVQASIPDSNGEIHACYYSPSGPVYGPNSLRKGDLRVIDTSKQHGCTSDETALSWSQTGPSGPSGPSGPQGPGATTFATTVARGTQQTLQTLSNGITVIGACGTTDGNPFLRIQTPSGSNLQLGGTENEGSVFPLDIVSGYSQYDIDNANPAPVGYDGIARDKSIGPIVHLDVHGNVGDPCLFWGMVIPSS